MPALPKVNHDELMPMVEDIRKEGFRVFLSSKGQYGFYTNKEGDRLVGFEMGLGGIKFSGNYTTEKPRQTGTGWALEEQNSYQKMFDTRPPRWAVGDINYRMTTLKEHLKSYGKSSRFFEVGVPRHEPAGMSM